MGDEKTTGLRPDILIQLKVQDVSRLHEGEVGVYYKLWDVRFSKPESVAYSDDLAWIKREEFWSPYLSSFFKKLGDEKIQSLWNSKA